MSTDPSDPYPPCWHCRSDSHLTDQHSDVQYLRDRGWSESCLYDGYMNPPAGTIRAEEDPYVFRIEVALTRQLARDGQLPKKSE